MLAVLANPHRIKVAHRRRRRVASRVRLPGQYFDVETGLNYNYFRNYEPGTGRYTSFDPVGLKAGPNGYSYVASNPLKDIDFFGLAPGDKWWEFTNRDFQRWYHQCWKEAGGRDATREELADAYAEWKARGSPKNGKCWGGGNECPVTNPEPDQSTGPPKPNGWWYLGAFFLFMLGGLTGQGA